jgi:hypothetical protein
MLSALLKAVLVRLVSEKVLLEVLLGLGDWAVPRTTNKLDDEIWAPVRKALGAETPQPNDRRE